MDDTHFVVVKEELQDEYFLPEDETENEIKLGQEDQETADVQIKEEQTYKQGEDTLNKDQDAETTFGIPSSNVKIDITASKITLAIKSNFSKIFSKATTQPEADGEVPVSPPQEVAEKDSKYILEGHEDTDPFKLISCTICQQMFRGTSNLRKHKKSTHMMLYSCLICRECFATTNELNEHSKVKHNLYHCAYCISNFGRYSCSYEKDVCTHD